MELIYKNQYVDIHDMRDEISDTIFINWKGYFASDEEECIKSCMKTIYYVSEYNAKIMISDHRFVEGTSIGFMEWLDETYFPTCIENGLKAEIVMDSEHALGSASLELIYDEEDFKANDLYIKHVHNFTHAKKLALTLLDKINKK